MGHQGVLWGLSAQSGHQGCSGVYLSKSAARGCSGAYLSKLATKGAPGTINPTWLRGGTPGPIYPNLPKSAPKMRPWAYTQIGHQASGTYHPNHPQGPLRFHLPNSATRGRIKAGFKRDRLDTHCGAIYCSVGLPSASFTRLSRLAAGRPRVQ